MRNIFVYILISMSRCMVLLHLAHFLVYWSGFSVFSFACVYLSNVVGEEDSCPTTGWVNIPHSEIWVMFCKYIIKYTRMFHMNKLTSRFSFSNADDVLTDVTASMMSFVFFLWQLLTGFDLYNKLHSTSRGRGWGKWRHYCCWYSFYKVEIA